jgi:dTDP-4-amino-4,6-dideoxygalactose transaminase
MDDLRSEGIATTFHYVPLHDSEGGRRFARRPTECPVTVDASTRLVRLPFFNTLTPDEVERVATSFVAAVERHG